MFSLYVSVNRNIIHMISSVLWIRIGFKADLGPAFYLSADAKPMRIQVDADPSLKIEFFTKNILNYVF
jgi:hypothetical protein